MSISSQKTDNVDEQWIQVNAIFRLSSALSKDFLFDVAVYYSA